MGFFTSKERRIKIKLDLKARQWLIERGYSPVYGARPLKRLLSKELETLIAKGIITGKISDGTDIEISILNDKPAIVS